MCFDFIRKRRIKRQLKNTVLEPKGIRLAVYCAKIYGNVLTDNDIIYAYERELRDMYRMTSPNNPYYDYDERQGIAANYLGMALNCANSDEVVNLIKEEIEDVH